MGWVSSNYVTGFTYRWDEFRAPVAGRYRVRFSGYTLWVPPGGIQMRFADEQRQGRHAAPAQSERRRLRHGLSRPTRRADHGLHAQRRHEPPRRRVRSHARARRPRHRRSVAARQRDARARRVALLPVAPEQFPQSADDAGRRTRRRVPLDGGRRPALRRGHRRGLSPALRRPAAAAKSRRARRRRVRFR